LANCFEVEPLRKIRLKADSTRKSPHRPLALDVNQEMAAVDFIRAGYASSKYVTRSDVLNFVEREFRKYSTCSWIWSFLGRNDNIAYATTVSPQQKVQLEVPRQFLHEYIKLIKDSVPLVPNALIFNIDKCGFRDRKRGRTNWSQFPPKPMQALSIIRKIGNSVATR
jgi:hypothetical protein